MRVFSSPANSPQDRGRHTHREASEASVRLLWLRSEVRVHRWHIVGALAVCVVATLIGLFGPGWLGSRDANFTGPRTAADGPAGPPVRVCGSKAALAGGPSSPPAGAVLVAAGNDARVN